MPDDGSDPEQPCDPLKTPRKGRWREKLFHRADHTTKRADKVAKQKLQLNTDIADFLNSPVTAVRPPQLDIEATTRKPVPPAVSRVGTPGTSTSRSSTSPPESSRQKRRARGLRVIFTNTAPVIIGEGGDEAELPSCEVAKAWKSAIHLPPSTPSHSSTTRVTPPTNQLKGDEKFTRMPIQRMSTGFNRKPLANLNPETPPVTKEQVAAEYSDYLKERERERTHYSRHGQPRLDQVRTIQKSEDQMTKLASEMKAKCNMGLTDELFLPPRYTGHEVEIDSGSLEGVAMASNKQPFPVQLPSTPRHPASEYMDMMSPYPDEEYYGSPVRGQESASRDRPTETASYDDTPASPDRFSRLGILRS